MTIRSLGEDEEGEEGRRWEMKGNRQGSFRGALSSNAWETKRTLVSRKVLGGTWS